MMNTMIRQNANTNTIASVALSFIVDVASAPPSRRIYTHYKHMDWTLIHNHQITDVQFENLSVILCLEFILTTHQNVQLIWIMERTRKKNGQFEMDVRDLK